MQEVDRVRNRLFDLRGVTVFAVTNDDNDDDDDEDEDDEDAEGARHNQIRKNYARNYVIGICVD